MVAGCEHQQGPRFSRVRATLASLCEGSYPHRPFSLGPMLWLFISGVLGRYTRSVTLVVPSSGLRNWINPRSSHRGRVLPQFQHYV